MKYKKVFDSETIITELMIPSYANFGGKVHGGVLLALMDKVAYVCATKHCQSYCVTVSVEGVEFLYPVEVGELLTIKASINYVGNTTMIIGMRVESQNPRTGINHHTNSCYFTMLAKSESGEHIAVPGLILENEVELRRFCEGKYLKKLSLEKRNVLRSDFREHNAQFLKEHCKDDKCEIKF
jgi:acyl-CoA hydrolase